VLLPKKKEENSLPEGVIKKGTISPSKKKRGGNQAPFPEELVSAEKGPRTIKRQKGSPEKKKKRQLKGKPKTARNGKKKESCMRGESITRDPELQKKRTQQ